MLVFFFVLYKREIDILTVFEIVLLLICFLLNDFQLKKIVFLFKII